MDFLNTFSPFGHDDAHNHYQDIYHTEEIQPHHKSSFTHEAIAGAAGFAAMRAYEAHLRATGEQPSHPVMKEILAGIAAAEVDKLAETKGLDWIDRHKAKKLAERQAHELAYQRYGGGTGWEYAQQQGGYAAPYNYAGGAPWGARGHEGYGAYGPPGSGGYYPQQPGGYYFPPPQGQLQGYPPVYGEQEYHHHHHHHHHG
ncbi:hypothetical protein Clacol_007339 [Clathrus columnatus]|uniref:CipC-like antibiotic response protein n=1 Tax=Clathrus columnatus TaxID=1419009 RepID=A0AAV5AK69_9AGAM|nr:hypothetical protein Clacol_007339 [Clathrus columnatus]